MKLSEHFSNFLRDNVNLNDSRVSDLETSVDSVKRFIRSANWDPRISGFAAQGSWAHKTIIKPANGAEFDADLLVFLDPVEGWEAKAYVDSLFQIFRESGTYKDKIRRYSHCVTIEYAGDKRIDIAPCINRPSDNFEVCNRVTNTFHPSAPEKYTTWLIEKNEITGSNNFRKATRLFKYMRDIKRTFTCPSILLTTLLGNQIYLTDKLLQSCTDVPTTVKLLFNRLDDWLQSNPIRPVVSNPVLPAEHFSDAWDDLKYSNFRDKIHLYRGWVDDAFDESEREESIGKWRRVFGEDFASSVAIDNAKKAGERSVDVAKETGAIPATANADLVSIVKAIGPKAISTAVFKSLPHMERPKWVVSGTLAFHVSVSATLHNSRNGPQLGQLNSGQVVYRNAWIKFFVTVAKTSLPLSSDFFVRWRITNTDQEAYNAGQLRGHFYGEGDGFIHWESTTFRGVHVAEAFVIRRRDNTLVSQSAPFYVVIE